MTSAPFAAAFFSLSGALLFKEHVHLRFRRHAVQKGPKAVVSRPVQAALRLGCRLRKGLANNDCHYDKAYDCEPFRIRCRVRDFISQRFAHRAILPSTLGRPSLLSRDCLCRKIGIIRERRLEFSKKLSGVAFQSQG
jgi:hypothetical protein